MNLSIVYFRINYIFEVLFWFCRCRSDTLVRYGFTPPRGADKIRTASGPAGLLEEIMNPHVDCEVIMFFALIC